MNEFYDDDDEFLLHFLLSKIFSKIQVVLFEGLQNDTRIILRSSIILFYAQRVQNLSQTLEGFRKQSGSFFFFFSVEHLRTTLAHVSSIARDARARRGLARRHGRALRRLLEVDDGGGGGT